jgi:hypothetical protein
MEQKIRCIYRKKKCFHVCNKTTIKNTFYCCRHIHSKKKHLCKIFYHILEERHDITAYDIFKIYKYIVEKTIENDDIFINILFIDLLKMIKIERLSKVYKDYFNNHNHSKDTKDTYSKIYELNKNTYLFNSKCNLNTLIGFQEIVKYKVLSGGANANYLNDEDIFTMESIRDIPSRRLFTIKDDKGLYGYDVVELEYFVRNCIKEGVVPYNPYTREAFSDKVIWRMNMKIKYEYIAKKTDDCRWTTDMNAYTDLSIEIERRGFYNNPEWFKKMPRRDFLKCIKLFRDFSPMIEESKGYFLNINANNAEDDDNTTFVYDFCKEGIRLFRECNDDLYILCCNFMKSLAICSNDFYSNIPEWLSTYETPSYVSNLPNISNFNSLISTLLNTRNSMTTEFGENLINNTNTNVNAPLPNPSNNFLLYYYVEYM